MGITDRQNLAKDVMIDLHDVLPKFNTKLDVVIINFSYKVTDALKEKGVIVPIEGQAISSVAHIYHVYKVVGTNIGFVNTTVGAPITAAIIEEMGYCFDCNNFVMFGSCGGLDKSLPEGKLIVPTQAFRDEGVSYHYYDGGDYIEIKNHKFVASVLDRLGVGYVSGRVWTTDAFYRETRERFTQLREQGCIAVDMELSACQAVSNYRGHELYNFLYRGDNLDAPKWDRGILSDITDDHRLIHFGVALEIAKAIISK